MAYQIIAKQEGQYVPFEAATQGAELFALFDDGRMERAFELGGGLHAGGGLPQVIPESMVSQYQGQMIPMSNDPSNTGFMAAQYSPASRRLPESHFWQDALPMAFVGGLGAMMAGGAAAQSAGTTTGTTTGATTTGGAVAGEGATAGMFGTGAAETLDASLIGAYSGPAAGSGSAFAPAVGGATGGALVGSQMVDGATSGSGAVSGGAAGAGAGTALSRIFDGTATMADYLSLGGNLGAALLGYLGADKQADAYKSLADQYMGMGAPSRARYEASFAPGFNMGLDPGYKDALDQTTKSFLHKASIGGNPADSPNAWMQTLKDVNSTFAYPALQDYRRLNANTGGLSRFAEAAPGMSGAAINADAGKLNAIGYGLGNIFNPPTTLEQLLKATR